jgi:hypothetical protein
VFQNTLPLLLVHVCYDIPTDLTVNKNEVELKFVSAENKIAGGIYGVKMVSEKI